MSDKPHTAAVAAPLAEGDRREPLEIPAERLLQDWRKAYERARTYAKALGLPERDREPLAREAVEQALGCEVWSEDSDAVVEALRALRRLVPERYPTAPRPWLSQMDAFLAWRLDTYISERFATPPCDGSESAPSRMRRRGGGIGSMPPLQRRPMVPDQIERSFLRRLIGGRLPPSASTAPSARTHRRGERRHLPWIWTAYLRRIFLAVLVLIPTVIASGFMASVLPHQATTWLGLFIVIFFGALFGWISIGFWTATLGFFTLLGKRYRFSLGDDDTDAAEIDPGARTAIVMPICEEPVDRVFAGLKAIYQSLERTGQLRHFDFFIMSDSGAPGTWVKEEEAWAAWCREVNGFDKIFYRRRRVRIERKSGNVGDFCRRWGSQYRYMIMLDADSIMAGETLVRLVRRMEAHPGAGMIQTAPTAVNRHSLLARVQQFAGRVYGPMFAAGLHFWQLGDGQYWGHNTIIRIQPFMDHCALPRLPGKPPLGGEILSHDFVEAALMGRAGWTLWLAFDLPGSYEEVPSTLLEEMKRDRRWCQGNLQHLRLLFTRGLFGAHRALFLNGVLSYVSALLWFTFLSLSTAEAIRNALVEPVYFPNGPSLFPQWPIWHPDWALWLIGVTGMILFLPKVLSVLLIIFKRRNARAYGGVIRLTFSVLLEILLSSLFAPIRMVFHSRFVVLNLLGRTVAWRSQGRGDAETGWGEAIRYHGFDTVFASAWGLSLYWLNPGYFWWVTPIIGALILSVPLSVLVSRVRLGDRARAWGLFLIPEETDPPQELRDLEENVRKEREHADAMPAAEGDGFVRAAVDPYINALHRALLGGSRSLAPAIRAARRALLERAVADGPAALEPEQRKILLTDPDLVTELHRRVWQIERREVAARWGRPAGETAEGGTS